MTSAIVVVAFNRPGSLERLLNCLNLGAYSDNNISLVISIDYQDSVAHTHVIDVAEKFVWKYGEKVIIQYENNLGLKYFKMWKSYLSF